MTSKRPGFIDVALRLPYDSVFWCNSIDSAVAQVQKLAREFLTDPMQVNIGGKGGKLVANKDVLQIIHKCSSSEKEDKLVELLTSLEGNSSIIIFANKKRDVDYIAQGVNTAGIWAESIHGDKDQWERQKSLENFAQGRAKCIVATDVAARGLDIKGIIAIFNSYSSSGHTFMSLACACC